MAPFGAQGHNVLIDKGYGAPRITKDGVKRRQGDRTVRPVREPRRATAASRSRPRPTISPGDGTTTATVLAQAIVRGRLQGGCRRPQPDGPEARHRPRRRGGHLGHQRPLPNIAGNDEIAQVGTISANSDREIGEIMANAVDQVGNDGVITVEEAKSLETELDVVEGIQFDRGYFSAYFVTNAEKILVELEKPFILLHEEKLSAPSSLIPLLETVIQRPAAADDCGGCRRRSAGDAGGQQARSILKSRPSSRPASATSQAIPGHRDPDRRTGDHRRPRRRAGNRQAQHGSARQQSLDHNDNTTIIDGAGESRPFRPGHRIRRADRKDDLGLRDGEAPGATRQDRGRRRVINVGGATESN